MSTMTPEAQAFDQRKAEWNLRDAAVPQGTPQPLGTLFVVAVYDTSRHYGGPEEGGWYYTNGPLAGLFGAWSDNDAATEQCWDLNQEFQESDLGREDRKVATVVELPRRELGPHIQPCHDVDFTEADYVIRWDIPTEYDEERKHYC